MNKIPSFNINHIRLLRGIYVSRRDKVGTEEITTFDIRMKEPNREPALHPGALHTIEHLAATYLRNNPEWKDSIVYWGPMGCLTGNYLLMRGRLEPTDILTLMQDTFRFVAEWYDYQQEVVGKLNPDEHLDQPLYRDRAKGDFAQRYDWVPAVLRNQNDPAIPGYHE